MCTTNVKMVMVVATVMVMAMDDIGNSLGEGDGVDDGMWMGERGWKSRGNGHGDGDGHGHGLSECYLLHNAPQQLCALEEGTLFQLRHGFEVEQIH